MKLTQQQFERAKGQWLSLNERIARVHRIVNLIATKQHDNTTEMVMADYVRSELDVIRALKSDAKQSSSLAKTAGGKP